MKKMILTFLSVLLCFACSSCSSKQQLPTTTVRFYYKAVSVEHGAENGVITWEDRELTGINKEASSIVEIYLNGSKKSSCIMPFPGGTKLNQYEQDKDSANVLLSTEATMLSDAEFTVASVCLARTVIEFTGVESVKISVSSTQEDDIKSITITPNSFVLYDFSTDG